MPKGYNPLTRRSSSLLDFPVGPMLDLTRHIIRISATRDKTEANAAMVATVQDLFQPLALSVGRCFTRDQKTLVFTCAGIGPRGAFSHNAYLPQPAYCRPLDEDPFMQQCQKAMAPGLDTLPDGSNRAIFPVIRHDHLLYIIDITLPGDIPLERRALLAGLVEYFSNHIALLDYAETDTLTGLANRKTFERHLFDLLGNKAPAENPNDPQQRRHGLSDQDHHWLAVCDIDFFKRINDGYGHLIGDEVLVVLAQLMRHSFRFEDHLFRFGGEEFIIVLQPTTPESAFNALERFRKAIASHRFVQIGQATVSIGFSRLLPTDTPSYVIDRADQALYYAKQHGRNQTAFYEALVESGEINPNPIHKGEVEIF